MSLPHQIKEWTKRVDEALEHWLPAKKVAPTELHKAMRYAVFNGGKRIRPSLVYAAGHVLGIDAIKLDAAACAVECIHAYSLIHDDLPAMDDDDLRRGKPSCHKAFDEATAILAGDALQALAFHMLAHGLDDDIPAQQKLDMIDLLAVASGSRGMAGGQALDLASTGKELTEIELENMHIHKTGALIRCSVKFATYCALEVDQDKAERLDHYAKCIGLAFQVQDDVLDEIGETIELGKPSGSDRDKNKPTYPALLGLQASRELTQELCEDALNSLKPFDERAKPLRELAQYIIKRTH